MSAPRDLGTYHVRVELADGQGWIDETLTGSRYGRGTFSTSPLNAERIAPTWDDEEDLISTKLYQYIDGNYSCDCNKRTFLAYAAQREVEDYPCGDSPELAVKRLTLIRPDGTEKIIYEV